MPNLFIVAALCAAMPLAAQDQQQSPPAQKPPAQDQQQDQSKPTPPTLEKPGEAAPEPEPPAPAKQPAKPGTKAPAKPAAGRPAAKAPEKVEKAPVEGANSRVVEEIIARVNNEVITRSELDKARSTVQDEITQDCQGKCTPEELRTRIDESQKNALRDLIDQSLLVQRGKDMGISVEPEVIKRLDQIRINNKLGSMEDLEKAVSSQGINWEDFKDNIRKGILTQRVISQEVGSHINVGKDEVEKYYNEHKKDFVRPEQVALREIVVNTEGKKDEELPDLKKKAETALKRVQDGEDFGEIAKRLSDGSTAKQGGFLGVYKRGELSKQLEDTVFKMKKNGLTEVMDTKQGYLILQVLEHYDEGEQPLSKVENEISEHLYNERMEPKLREYLKTLREQSYVVIKPGYQDIAGGGNSEIQEVNATPEVTKSKKGRKKFLLFGKRAGQASGA
jgi:peptidyl-prolyl cis-trans isomerase SurA